MDLEKVKRQWYTPEQWDNDEAFRQMIYKSVGAESRVLDAGAGSGYLFHYDLKNGVAEIVGVDLGPGVETNPQLHRGIRADLNNIPFEQDYFDIVFCRYVLEHIEYPQKFLREMFRILRPGGRFLFLCPNKYHYVSLISRLTPHSFHTWYNKKRGRKEQDTCRTFYRMNSVSELRKHFRKAGLVEERLLLRECSPNYLAFSRLSFAIGLAYERIVNRYHFLASLRVNILGSFMKPEENLHVEHNGTT